MTKFEEMLKNYTERLENVYTEDYIIREAQKLEVEMAKRNLMKWLENLRRFAVTARGYGLASTWIDETEKEVETIIIPALDSGDDSKATWAYFMLQALNDVVEYGNNIIENPRHFMVA